MYELRTLTKEEPIWYLDKKNVYFVLKEDKLEEILTTRYVAETNRLIECVKAAKKSKTMKIIVVWPGQWRSEAFYVDPVVFLKEVKSN